MERRIHVPKQDTFTAFSKTILGFENEDIDKFEIRLDWETLHLIEFDSSNGDNSGERLKPASHVLVLEDSASPERFMATTCEKYLTGHFDRVWSSHTLQLLDSFTDTPLKGVAPVKKRTALVQRLTGLRESAPAAEIAAAVAR